MFKTFLITIALFVSVGNAMAQNYTVVFLPDGTQMVCWNIGGFIQCNKQ